jgi:2-dehydropantoate 2-reductase
MPRIAFVGVGSVGTFFAAHLAAAGHDVLACARRGFDTYVVESPEAPVTAPARVVTDPAAVTDGPYPWVVVAVKAHQTADAAPWFGRLCGPGSVVVAVQNGVEATERFTPLVNGAAVVPSVVYCGAELQAPGHIHHHARGTLMLPEGEASAGFAQLFAATPADVRPIPTYVTEAWRKLSINVVVNGITALTQRRMGVMREPGMADLAESVLRECYAVARAEGADLADDDIGGLVASFAKLNDAGGTSMLYDRLAGRPLEHDALYGAVIRAGERHGIPTPTHRTFSALLSAC